MFKAGDKVRVVGQDFIGYGSEGTVLESNDGMCLISFGESAYWLTMKEIERIEDMDISERLSEVIKENQNLKQQISEQNIKINKIQADARKEHGVTDEEFREAFVYWENHSNSVCMNIWDGEYELRDIFNSFSLSDFVNKYKEFKEYKDKQNEIRVGDEVYYLDHNHKTVVTSVEDGVAVMFSSNGKWSTCITEGLHKTGKHYDIESILNGLKDGD